MDQHPAVRRKPRKREVARPHAPARQTYSVPTVLLITEDAHFLAPEFSSETLLWHWHAENGAQDDAFGGDPTDPATYEFVREIHDLSAIVALGDHDRCEAVAAAIQQVNPQAAVLVVADQQLDEAAGPLARLVDWRAALRARLETELRRLESRKRVEALRAFVEDAPVVPILIHQDPDPDALASALAIRVLLRREPNEAPILTLDEITRPENRRMAELLEIQVTQVTQAELLGFDRIICADMQPRDFKGTDNPRLAVIDHHPPENGYNAEYVDIRPNYGATATLLTEYIRVVDERYLGDRLATALVYAIKTDTDNLTRGVNPADVAAYTFLLDRVDVPLLRRIERPAYAERTARAYGRGIADMRMHNDLAVAFLGNLSVDDSHILADVADFILAMDEATWAAAAALVEGRLVINIRHLGSEPGAGALARLLAKKGGSGGGHSTMARAVLNLEKEWDTLTDAPLEEARDLLLEQLGTYVEQLR